MTSPASAHLTALLAPALATLALIVAAPAAAQDARDFQLPPGPTPTPESRVQGPVDPEAPVPQRPRAIETARPAAPTPAASPTPQSVRPQASATPSPAPPGTAAPPARRAPPASRTASLPADPLPAGEPPNPSAPLAAPMASATPIQPWAPPPAPAGAAGRPGDQVTIEPTGSGQNPVAWLALAALGAGLAIALFLWRRRTRRALPEFVPPVVPAPPAGHAAALAIGVEAVRLDRSVLNATAGYRITLRNRTAQAITGICIEADLISANRERPVEQQLASPGQPLTPRHAAERLAPGQSLRFEGQVRLPLSEVSAIWQGRVGLLVPLLRVRATATDALPVATTLVIGQAGGAGARPQPFRLDEPPRSYAPLAQRTLDAAPVRA